MGDRVGLFVLFGVILVLVVGYFLVGPRHRSRQGDDADSFNSHRDATVKEREDHPEGAERSHLVGNPPIDTITSGSWGVATPGQGAEPEELPEDVHPEMHVDRSRRHRH